MASVVIPFDPTPSGRPARFPSKTGVRKGVTGSPFEFQRKIVFPGMSLKSTAPP